MTIAEIREQYPSPSPLADMESPSDQYCVGGAICCAFGTPLHFPAVGMLARVLSAVNPTVTWENALLYANAIVWNNDTGNFERAWQLAAQALGEVHEPSRT